MVRFTRKKIETLTLGERLKKIRTDHRLSISEIAKSTKIQAKYIEYLENGEYMKLPADVYVKGFLKSYAAYLSINENTLIKQFEREKGIHKNIKKIDNEEKIKPLNFSSFVITPRMMIVSSVSIVVFSAFIYLYREVNSFVSSPRLVILKPSDGESIEGKIAHVVGVAEKDSYVSINEQSVMVNDKGEFSQDVGLQSGVNTITVKAKNRFDKLTTKSFSINANFENQNFSADQIESIPQEITKPFEMEIKTNANSTWISVEADGGIIFSGVIAGESSQKFKANEKITITSGKGNAISISIDGKDFGLLSESPDVIKDVLFTSNGRVNK